MVMGTRSVKTLESDLKLNCVENHISNDDGCVKCVCETEGDTATTQFTG